jgi:hypothetical protein
MQHQTWSTRVTCAVAALLLGASSFAACVHGQATLLPEPTECASGQVVCAGACVDTELDRGNCGSCDNACGDAELCSLGMCSSECMGGTSECESVCVDLQLDPMNCGGCSNACADGELCSQGNCGASCTGATVECSGACVDTNNDSAHCGGCDSPCANGESCTGGQCYALDCRTLLLNDTSLADGPYTIDPDGSAGEPPFEVSCNMSTDGGGWIELSLNDSDNLLAAESSATNNWQKCADDSAKHFDWITEGMVTVDVSNGNTDTRFMLSYLNPQTMVVYTDAQIEAVRRVIGELSSTTRMVALTADDDSGDWQTTMVSGHEVYITGSSMTETLLTPGEDGECGSSTTTPGSQAGYYLWHNSAMSSVVDGTTGLNNGDLTGLGIGDLIPVEARLVVATGGGCAFGWEKQIFLVR